MAPGQKTATAYGQEQNMAQLKTGQALDQQTDTNGEGANEYAGAKRGWPFVFFFFLGYFCLEPPPEAFPSFAREIF
jgi:hypothetical protein